MSFFQLPTLWPATTSWGKGRPGQGGDIQRQGEEALLGHLPAPQGGPAWHSPSVSVSTAFWTNSRAQAGICTGVTYFPFKAVGPGLRGGLVSGTTCSLSTTQTRLGRDTHLACRLQQPQFGRCLLSLSQHECPSTVSSRCRPVPAATVPPWN